MVYINLMISVKLVTPESVIPLYTRAMLIKQRAGVEGVGI